MGAMFKSLRKDTYQSHGRSLQLPPSYRFPPLREGNRARVRFPPLRGEPRKGSVPPARRGNLKEGVFNPLVFANLSSRLV